MQGPPRLTNKNPDYGPIVLRHTATLVLMLLLAWGPHGLLQGVAWSGMLVSYSLQDGLLQGAKDTFGGERPCEMCVALQQQEEDSPALARSGDELRLQVFTQAIHQAYDRLSFGDCLVGRVAMARPDLHNGWKPAPPQPIPIATSSS